MAVHRGEQSTTTSVSPQGAGLTAPLRLQVLRRLRIPGMSGLVLLEAEALVEAYDVEGGRRPDRQMLVALDQCLDQAPPDRIRSEEASAPCRASSKLLTSGG